MFHFKLQESLHIVKIAGGVTVCALCGEKTKLRSSWAPMKNEKNELKPNPPTQLHQKSTQEQEQGIKVAFFPISE